MKTLLRRLLPVAVALQPLVALAAPETPATGESYATPMLLGFGFAAAGVVMFWARRYHRRRSARRNDGER